jgi:protease IV
MTVQDAAPTRHPYFNRLGICMLNTTDSNRAVDQLLQAMLVEQRRKRRWGIFFKSIFFLYVIFLTLAFWKNSTPLETPGASHSSVINIDGLIADNTKNSADNLIKSLNAAFSDKGTRGVILNINSPGGTPVQSAYVYDEVQRLRVLHPKIKIYAVCSDLCASGAYYIAASANEIYANPSSLVGSIGVLMDRTSLDHSRYKQRHARSIFSQ